MNILYVSYDGVLEPLGQSQVLAYLVKLARAHKIILISFEKTEDWMQVESREALRARVTTAGIKWIPLRYHKRPSSIAKLFDILQGFIVGAWVVIRHRVCIVHARSYVPSVMALALKKLFRVKYIFDMRGFWADERVEGGLWPTGGRMYRVAKWFERRFLLNADCVVSLTRTAVDEMRTFPYLLAHMPRFEQMTTCTDLELFRPASSDPLRRPVDLPFTLGYVGSVGVWYLFDETLRCFQLLRQQRPDARMHIINRGGHDYIRERIAALEIDPENILLEEAGHKQVALSMQQMDAGIFFYKPTYSKKATAPTKLGEFLGCGVPCLGNGGVGDMASILENERVGVAMEYFDEPSMREAIDRLLRLVHTPGVKERCRDVAIRHFSLERGVAQYAKIYNDLAGNSQ